MGDSEYIRLKVMVVHSRLYIGVGDNSEIRALGQSSGGAFL
jgi:hypothetical protein